MLHLVAGAVWLGGLVAIALVLRDLAARDDAGRGGAEPLLDLGASGVLAVLVVTGTFRPGGSPGRGTRSLDTGYGGLLLVKVLLVLVAIAIAAWNRFSLLPRLRTASGAASARDAARCWCGRPLAEAGVLVAVLAGDRVPGRPQPRAAVAVSAAGCRRPQRGAAVRLDDITAEVTLEPLGRRAGHGHDRR